jgi:hypothetical protein
MQSLSVLLSEFLYAFCMFLLINSHISLKSITLLIILGDLILIFYIAEYSFSNVKSLHNIYHFNCK